MGWGRTLFLGDIGNRLDIADTEQDIQQLKLKLDNEKYVNKSQDEVIRELAVENAQAKLYLAALVRLLLSKGTITQDELEVMVNTIDAEDGSADGKLDGDIV